MGKSGQVNLRTYARAMIAVAMMVTWSLVATSGLLLWLAPRGPRSGFQLLLFELTKHEWGELHVWFSVIAMVVTAVHLIVDWRGLCGCMKYLTSVHRSGSPANYEAPSSRPAQGAT